MKKTAIAVALAGLVAAPAAFADTTVYGSARAALNYKDDDSEERTNWKVQNQASRLGFRGAEDLGRGLSAIYHYEFGVNIAEGSEIGGSSTGGRLSYVGLKGGLGQVSIGRQWNPYYFAVGGEVDVFNGDFSANGYYENGGFTRSNSMLYYATPAFFGGLTLYGTMEFDGDAGDSDMDAYSISAIYDNGPLFIGAGWKGFSKQTGTDWGNSNNRDDNMTDACGVDGGNIQGETLNYYGVQGRYNFAFGLGISASYQYCDNNGNGNREVKRGNFDIQGVYQFGNNSLRLGYFWRDKADDATDGGFDFDTDAEKRDLQKLNGLIAGYQYRFSRRSRVWVEGGWSDYSSCSDCNITNVSVGMRHDF